ncbi:hypothetical protein XO10_00545 [Marinitoga sp. 1135]|uniref:hypothetical protein n=1 Tax=Marinitoga sp. 1135 TaxID=1643333 RepID=UPI001586B1E5|nr:hypothetical protein [Marinitoga sp. 1135]NUU94808.1 hypothetical protein [Marinitoga sp. 1135]
MIGVINFERQYEQILEKLPEKFTKIEISKDGYFYVLRLYRGKQVYRVIRKDRIDKLMFTAANYMGV